MNHLKLNTLQADKEPFEVAIVGAGPKGLALQSELVRTGIKSIVLEAFSHAGQQWSPQRMHEDRFVTPEDIEITTIPEFQFKPFRFRQYPENAHLKPTASQFYAYLNWLKEKLPHIETDSRVECVDFCGNEFHLTCHGRKNISAKNLVLATGVSGYGGVEFTHYPLDTKESEHISHYPAKLVHPQEIQAFIGEAKSIAILGGNITGLEVLKEACALSSLEEIHVVACGQTLANAPESIKTLELDETRKLILKTLVDGLPHEGKNPRRFYYPFKAPKAIEEKGDNVFIELPEGKKLKVDRLILATGFHYNFRALPFLKEGLLRHADIRMAADGRHPQVDTNQRLITSSAHLPIYVMGEGAAVLGESYRRLPTAIHEARTIVKSIRENFSEAISQMK